MRIIFTISIFLLILDLSGQGITDSLFHIGEIEIVSDSHFSKEEAGFSVLRVDSSAIRHKIFMDMSDLLSENSSIYIKDYGRGALSTASFRGTSPSHTQLTWNGMTINSPMLGMVDFALVPVFIMDEIEITASGGSVPRAGGALGGLVSVKNSPDFSRKFSGRYYQSAGSFRTFDEMASINLAGSILQSGTKVYHSFSGNNYEFENRMVIEMDPETGELFHPMTENRQADYAKAGVMQEFYYRPGQSSMVSLRAWYQDAGRSIPTVVSSELYDAALQRTNRQTDRSLRAVAEYSFFSEKTDLEIRSGIVSQAIRYRLTNLISGLDPISVVNSHSGIFSWNNHAGVGFTPSDKLSIRFNGSLQKHRIHTLDSTSMDGYTGSRIEFSLFSGAYLQPLHSLQLSLQLRQTMVTGQQVPLVFSAGFNFRPETSGNLVFKGSFTRNAHVPSLNDLYWQPGGNPDLLPEKGGTTEFGARYDIKRSGLSADFGMTAFYSNITDWIIWLPGFKGYWQPLNIARVRAHGLETDFSFSHGWKELLYKLDGTISITRTRNFGDPLFQGDGSYGKQLPFIPVVSGNLLAVVSYRKYYIRYQYNGLGERYLLSSSVAGLEDDTPSLLGYDKSNGGQILYPHHLNSMSLGRSFNVRTFSITTELRVNNLFNETYRNILQRMMPGRHYLFMINLEF